VKTTLLGLVIGLLVASEAFAQTKPPLASVEARWPDVFCDLTELARTSESEITVRWRYRNTSKTRFALPHIDLVPGTRVLDPIGKTIYHVLKDASGETIGSTTMDGITGRPIPANGSQAHWARLEPPPTTVASLTILVPGCQPFDDVPFEGAAMTVPQVTASPAVATQEGEAEGLVVDITGVRRGLGGALTLTFRYRNTGTGNYTFPHRPVVREAYLLDSKNRRKYTVITDRKQQPLCGETLNLQFPDGVRLEPGETIALWAKFPAPPDSTKAVTVHLPFAPPFDNIEPSGTASGSGGGGAAVSGAVVGLDAALKDLGASVTETEIRIDLSADVLFDFDKAEIRKAAEPSLQKVATVLKANPTAKVAIEGHTDGKGADAYNQTLSEQRAASVKQWLVANAKVDGATVTTRGWGKTKPVAHNTKPDGSDDPEGRAKNRRVEIVVRNSG
jgi:outer membrane protein OmpA-like peptidoglycan-associated protein